MMKESRDPNRRGRRQAGDSATLLKTNEGRFRLRAGDPRRSGRKLCSSQASSFLHDSVLRRERGLEPVELDDSPRLGQPQAPSIGRRSASTQITARAADAYSAATLGPLRPFSREPRIESCFDYKSAADTVKVAAAHRGKGELVCTTTRR